MCVGQVEYLGNTAVCVCVCVKVNICCFLHLADFAVVILFVAVPVVSPEHAATVMMAVVAATTIMPPSKAAATIMPPSTIATTTTPAAAPHNHLRLLLALLLLRVDGCHLHLHLHHLSWWESGVECVFGFVWVRISLWVRICCMNMRMCCMNMCVFALCAGSPASASFVAGRLLDLQRTEVAPWPHLVHPRRCYTQAWPLLA